MESFSSISFTEFEDLVMYLGSLDKAEAPEERIFSIVKKLYGFFPTLDSDKALELNALVSACYLRQDNAPELFCSFKEHYPELEFDATGHSKPDVNYYDWTHQTLTMLLAAARGLIAKNGEKDTDKNKSNKQTVDAYELKPLKAIPNLSYPIEKMKYLKGASYHFYTKDELSTLETQLEWLLGKEASQKALAKVLEYLMRKAKPENSAIFASHFQARVGLAYHDSGFSYPETSGFIDNLKKAIL